MPAKKKTTKKAEEIEEVLVVEEKIEEKVEKKVEEKKKEEKKPSKKAPKYAIGSIVYVTKDTEVDLNGFNFAISQYKNSTYTVEAYDENTDVYSLRHLKLLVRLKEANLMAPDEKAHDSVNRIQF